MPWARPVERALLLPWFAAARWGPKECELELEGEPRSGLDEGDECAVSSSWGLSLSIELWLRLAGLEGASVCGSPTDNIAVKMSLHHGGR